MRVALLSLLSATAIASAQEALVGYGVGAQGCGIYIEKRRIPDSYYDASVGQWFLGFASAYNLYAGGQQVKLAGISQFTVLAYLDKFCRDKPLASISIGAAELIKVYATR